MPRHLLTRNRPHRDLVSVHRFVKVARHDERVSGRMVGAVLDDGGEVMKEELDLPGYDWLVGDDAHPDWGLKEAPGGD